MRYDPDKAHCVVVVEQEEVIVHGPYSFKEARAKEADLKAQYKAFPWVSVMHRRMLPADPYAAWTQPASET